MIEQTFVIKSLYVQNVLMLCIGGIILFFLVRSLLQKNLRVTIISSLWFILIFWFFNSQFWGFSALTQHDDTLTLHYGVLSLLKNESIPMNKTRSIESSFSGFPQYKRLYYLVIDERRSMGVEQRDKKNLEDILLQLDRTDRSF